MTQGTPGNARKPQTGTARKASKAASRDRAREPEPAREHEPDMAQMIERTRLIIDTRPLMSLADCARYLGVGRHTVGRMIDDGRLRGVTVNGQRKVRPADVDAMLLSAAS